MINVMMKKKRNYFEGWYFREQTEDLTIAFVPTLHYDEEGRMTGSLQVILPEKSWFFAYDHPVNMNLPDSLFVVLGKNVFTEACIHLDIDEPGLRIKGDIYFDREPGAKLHVMGPLGLPLVSRLLPCAHKIWATEQELSGELEILAGGAPLETKPRKGTGDCADVAHRGNGKVFSFNDGKGYMEADYGKTFPKTYFWTHCNWFDEKNLRIACAGVELSFAGYRGAFLGCFACIDQDGYKVKLATYLGARVEHFSADGFRIRQGKYVFEGWKMEGKPVKLQSPRDGAMGEKTDEYLTCTVRYKLSRGGEVIFDEISQRAAYEFR